MPVRTCECGLSGQGWVHEAGDGTGGGPVSGRWRTYGATAAAVTAAVGAKAVDADSAWYRSPAQPPWQPPPWTFGVVWTPLFGRCGPDAGVVGTAPLDVGDAELIRRTARADAAAAAALVPYAAWCGFAIALNGAHRNRPSGSGRR
ncbi:hypothetical protein GCM10009736_13200 [Actinomadura bangladeshensis]